MGQTVLLLGMKFLDTVIFNYFFINSGKCLLHTPKEDDRSVDGHGGGGGKKVKKMKKDRSFSGASGGSQQVRNPESSFV